MDSLTLESIASALVALCAGASLVAGMALFAAFFAHLAYQRLARH